MLRSCQVGHPTIIVNNAGVVQGKLILDLTPEDVKQYAPRFFILLSWALKRSRNRTFAVNTLAHFWTLKAFLPAMIQANSGHIVSVYSHCSDKIHRTVCKVTVASVLGVLGCAQMSEWTISFLVKTPFNTSSFVADYCASKAALVSLNQSLRYELDKR
jgi:NAD(P)-dependent dehydrogenase (short-subunit alcohol dehydrogenase family)